MVDQIASELLGEHPLCHEEILVGILRAPEQGDLALTKSALDLVIRFRPACLDQCVSAPDERLRQPLGTVIEFMPKLAPIAGPFLVDGFVGAAVDADHFVDAVIEPNAAAVRAASTNRG